MRVVVAHPSGLVTAVEVETSDTVAVVKRKIEDKVGIPIGQQRLTFTNGLNTDEGFTLAPGPDDGGGGGEGEGRRGDAGRAGVALDDALQPFVPLRNWFVQGAESHTSGLMLLAESVSDAYKDKEMPESMRALLYDLNLRTKIARTVVDAPVPIIELKDCASCTACSRARPVISVHCGHGFCMPCWRVRREAGKCACGRALETRAERDRQDEMPDLKDPMWRGMCERVRAEEQKRLAKLLEVQGAIRAVEWEAGTHQRGAIAIEDIIMAHAHAGQRLSTPTGPVTSTHIISVDCAACKKPFVHGPIDVAACGHAYCHACIQRRLQIKRTCVVCEKEINPNCIDMPSIVETPWGPKAAKRLTPDGPLPARPEDVTAARALQNAREPSSARKRRKT